MHNALFTLTLQIHLENLKTCFCKRGYQQKFTDAQIKRVSTKSSDELFERCGRKETGVLLFAIYHPRFHNLNVIIRKYFTFLYAEGKIKRVFTPPPYASFHFGYSLRNHLVGARVYTLIREKGTLCCGKNRGESRSKIK